MLNTQQFRNHSEHNIWRTVHNIVLQELKGLLYLQRTKMHNFQPVVK